MPPSSGRGREERKERKKNGGAPGEKGRQKKSIGIRPICPAFQTPRSSSPTESAKLGPKALGKIWLGLVTPALSRLDSCRLLGEQLGLGLRWKEEESAKFSSRVGNLGDGGRGVEKKTFLEAESLGKFFPLKFISRFFPSSVRAGAGGDRRHVGGTDFRPVVSRSTGKLVLEKQFGDIC